MTTIGLEGHQVTVKRKGMAEVYGTLKRYSALGATIWVAGSYGGTRQDHSGDVFIPADCILEILSHGETPR